MQKAYLFLANSIAGCKSAKNYRKTGKRSTALPVQEVIGKSGANYLRISYSRLQIVSILG